MSIIGYKRLTITLGILCVVFAALSVATFIGAAPYTIRLIHGSDQVEVFDEMRTQAVQSGPKEAAECLEYVLYYYPSGTKQERGSRLDRMVESSRAAAIREIIADLRFKTGEDLGNGAEPWIQKYGKN